MIDEDDVRARLASDFMTALQGVSASLTEHGLDHRFAADAMLAAACAALLHGMGHAALAAHLRQVADRLERDGGPPEFH